MKFGLTGLLTLKGWSGIYKGYRAVVLLFCSLLSMGSVADEYQEKVNRVKAAFIYNIAKFVDWPESRMQHETLQMCFYRTDFLGESFDSILGRDVHGKPVASEVVPDLDSTERCNILLISRKQLISYTEEYAGRAPEIGLLTIMDLTNSRSPNRAIPGVSLSLVRRNASIGFEVSLQQVRERELRMNSQLLKLAHILDDEVSN